MKLFSSFVALAATASLVLAAEKPKDERLAAEIYDNGKVHQGLIERKYATWDKQREAGAFDSTQYKSIDEVVKCVNGTAVAVEGDPDYTFRCKNLDLYNFKSHAELGSATGEGSSSWGWTSPDGREIIVVGQADGAAFAEITSEGKIVYLGRLPHNSVESIWREIRVYKNYAIIGSEAFDHYVQIFDLNKVLDIDTASPVTFSNDKDLTGLFTGLPSGRTHNVVVNEAKDYAVAVGAWPRNDTCAAGLIFIDLSDPSNPTTPACNAEDGYVHDAQCLEYKGPDEKYQGRDICYGYNEDSLTIYDVTDKTNSTIISKTSYDGASYTHQGWVLDPEWQTFLLLDDELDEADAAGPAANGHPTTFIWNITNLETPKLTGYYQSEATGIDHNQYVHDGHTYQSNYGSGLRILDISSIPEDPTGAGVKEVAFFDIYPQDDNEPSGGIVDFVGTWSSYSYFKSGFITVNTIEAGLFVVKRNDI